MFIILFSLVMVKQQHIIIDNSLQTGMFIIKPKTRREFSTQKTPV